MSHSWSTPDRRASVALVLLLTAAACGGSGVGSIGPTIAPATTGAAAATPGASAPVGGGPSVVGRGDFHDVDGTVKGYAQLIHLANGSFEIALEDFSIAAIPHTNVILAANADVKKTTDIDARAILDLGPLKAPTGMQDFAIPTSMSGNVMRGYHTVVIWDTVMQHAIAVAPLMGS